MASVYKRKRYTIRNGRKVKLLSKCWYIKYRDADGEKQVVKGYTDKEATRQMAARLEKEAALTSEGMVDRYKEHRTKPLMDHLEDFRQSLLAKGDTARYVGKTVMRAGQIIAGCKFGVWDDIAASKVEIFLKGLRDGNKKISTQTSNYYLQAIKQFCTWMVDDQRANTYPIRHLKRLNTRTDRRHDRRGLELDEMKRLLEATAKAPTRFGMTGPERAMLYRMAVETGLRANELRTLKVSSFDLEGCMVTVQAAYSKNRKEATLPLRPGTAAELRTFFANKLPAAQAFAVPRRTADMFKADLAATGEEDESERTVKEAIPYVDEAGRYVDFHALRHTCGTWLAACGVHPKVMQQIMRHCDINLTMRYTHVLTGQQAQAVSSLPDLSLGQSAKTGTHD